MEKEVRKELIKNLRNYEEFLDSAARIQDFPDNKFQNLFNKKTEGMNLLNKNLLLKEMLSDYLKGSYKKQVVNFWIINKWGGIPWKSNTDNQARITKFSEELADQKNLMYSDNAISSISKVMSFVNPQKYFIYDSRAVFSLNWLLYKSGEKANYYCQPQSQGKIAPYFISNFICDKLGIKIKKSVNVKMYLDYCNLINELYPEVFDEDKEKQPYKLEMLLFWIAKEGVNNIINDFTNSQEYDEKYYHPEVLKRKHKQGDMSGTRPKSFSANEWDKLKKLIPKLMQDASISDNNCEIIIKDCVLRLKTYKKRIKGCYQTFGIGNIIDGKEKERIINALKKEFDAKQVDSDGTIFVRNLDTNPSDENQRIKWFADNIQKIINIL